MSEDNPRKINNPVQFEQELARDREFYETNKERIRQDYGQQYVAIAQGRIVAVSPSFDEATLEVSKLASPPEHFLVFRADDEPFFEPYFDPFLEFTDEVIQGE